jgi:hypothetical protein
MPAKMAVVTRTTPTPATAVDSSSVSLSPFRASAASATTGRRNLNDMFTIPVSSVDSAMLAGLNPHDVYME